MIKKAYNALVEGPMFMVIFAGTAGVLLSSFGGISNLGWGQAVWLGWAAIFLVLGTWAFHLYQEERVKHIQAQNELADKILELFALADKRDEQLVGIMDRFVERDEQWVALSERMDKRDEQWVALSERMDKRDEQWVAIANTVQDAANSVQDAAKTVREAANSVQDAAKTVREAVTDQKSILNEILQTNKDNGILLSGLNEGVAKMIDQLEESNADSRSGQLA